MEVDRLREELDEAKADIQRLRADLKSKTELSESLRKAHSDQLIQLKEAGKKIERQSEELYKVSEELSEVKQTCDTLRCSLNEKESALRHLAATNDRLRVDGVEKFQKWEEEKRELVFALDQSNEKNGDQDRTIQLLKDEIEGLQRVLSDSKKKFLEAERNSKAPRDGEEIIYKLEEQNRKLENQLKWKKEQFKHLEEAHDKLRAEFKASKKEWELEKSALIDKVCSLEVSLDSQTRISEDLQKRLQMCNQALAHEETRRKYLEIELLEYKSRFESVFTEWQDTKLQLECLTTQRDKEIASLRSSLGIKEMLCREMEYQTRRLEQENQELLASVKELQEARIQELGASSLSKLRSRLRSMEQVQRDSSAAFKAKEVEWGSRLENLTRELDSCRSVMDCKEASLKTLELELDNYFSGMMHLKLQNEESAVMLLVLKSAIADLVLNIGNDKRAENVHTEREEKLFFLMKELEVKNMSLEQENQELLASVKELQEARIQELGASSLSKLRSRLRSMEQVQRDSSAAFKAKEVEWGSRLENLTRELDSCRSVMDCKEASLKTLELELDNYFSGMMHLKLQNEESAVMLLVLKSAIADLVLNIGNDKRAENVHTEREEKLFFLMKELEVKNMSLDRVSADVEVERQKAATLAERIDTLESNEHKLLLQQKELERCKEMLADSSARLMSFKEQALQKETELNDKIRALCDALDAANSDLAVEHDKAITLARRVETLDTVEGKRLMLQKELEKYEEMLDESTRYQIQLEQQALENKSVSTQKFEEVNDELAAAKSELAEYCKKATFLSRRVESLVVLEEKEILMQEELTRCKESLRESCRKQQSLAKELRKVCDALDSANSQLAEEHEKAESLCQRCESLEEALEEKQLMMQKEIGFYQEKLKDSSRYQLHLEEQATLKEKQYMKKHKEAYDELDKVNSELATKICESHSVEFELWIWKSIAERLKDELEENHALRKEVEASLLAQVEVGENIQHEKDSLVHMLHMRESTIANLQQKIQLYEQESETACSARAQDILCFDSEKERILRMTREKDKLLENLQEEIGWLEEESLRRELEVAVLFANEKESIMKLVGEKERRTADLMQHVASLERRYNSSMISFSSELAQKQSEIVLVHEAWEKIAAAEILTQLEIEEKKLMILDLEGDITSIQQKLELQAQSTSYKKEQSMKIEADLEAKQMELQELIDVMATKLKSSKGLVDELKAENESLVQDVKNLCPERANMLGLLITLSNRISQFSTEDMGLLGTLERIVQTFDNDCSSARIGQDDPSDNAKENASSRPSPRETKFEAIVLEERSPFRELN